MIYKEKKRKNHLKFFLFFSFLFFFNKESSRALQKANVMVKICWEISSVIYKKKEYLNDFLKFL